MFEKRKTIKEVEEGQKLSPKFNKDGFIPAVTTDSKTGELLMHAFMNDEALRLTIKTKEAHYYSRSRKCIWHKGATSGFVQKIDNILIDDDQDYVECVGDELTGAHPKIFLNLKDADGQIECYYCGKSFIHKSKFKRKK